MAGSRTRGKKQAQVKTWAAYVEDTIEPGERQVDVARRAGLDQTTVSRWLNGERKSITSQSVAKFARAYERPVLEAFVVAGFLTSEEAGISFSDLVDWGNVSDRELLAEVRRRMAHSFDAAHKNGARVSTGRVSSG